MGYSKGHTDEQGVMNLVKARKASQLIKKAAERQELLPVEKSCAKGGFLKYFEYFCINIKYSNNTKY